MNGIAASIDAFLAIVKWPVALAALALLPGSALALGDILAALFEGGVARVLGEGFRALLGEGGKTLLQGSAGVVAFLLGFAAYLGAWRLVLRKRFTGSFFSTLEHEATHGVVALATFHPIAGLLVTWNQGGAIRYMGRGNWLITTAPYFLPTVSILFVAAFYGFAGAHSPWGAAIFGVTIAYHAVSTWVETHAGQSDLRKVGFPFALAFLPTANLLCYGMLIAFAREGSGGIAGFLAATAANTQVVLDFMIAAVPDQARFW